MKAKLNRKKAIKARTKKGARKKDRLKGKKKKV